MSLAPIVTVIIHNNSPPPKSPTAKSPSNDSSATFTDIYLDDTVEIIKKKIINSLDYPMCYEEMYMYTIVPYNGSLQPLTAYQTLTNQEERKIDPDMFNQFIQGFGYLPIDDLTTTIQSYKEFEELFVKVFQSASPSRLIPIGIEPNNLLFPVNPLNVIYPYKAPTPPPQYEQKLLFEYTGSQPTVTIHVCLAGTVKQPYKYYFPNLVAKKIMSNLTNKQRLMLLENDTNMDTDPSMQIYYEPLPNSLVNQPKISSGLTAFTMYILPSSQAPSLDIIFNSVHSTLQTPVIFYQKKTFNIFRLYCEQVATNGKKIPLLERTLLTRLWRSMLKNRRITGVNSRYVDKHQEKITLAVQFTYKDTAIDWFIDFKYNGVITVYCEHMDIAYTFDELGHMFSSVIHPILHSINENLENTGFVIPVNPAYFHTGPIENLTYLYKTQLTTQMHLMETLQCARNLFIPMRMNKQVAELNYKRISEFKRLSPELTYLIQQIDEFAGEANQRQLVYDMVKKYFPYLDNEAQLDALYARGIEELDKGSTVSPGFPTLVTIDDRRNCSVEISQIGSIHYMPIIQNYLNSLINLSTTPDLLCKGLKGDGDERVELLDSESDAESDSDSRSTASNTVGKRKIGYYEAADAEDEEEAAEAAEEEEEAEKVKAPIKAEATLPDADKKQKISTLLLRRLQKQAPKLFDYELTYNKKRYEPYSRKCSGDNKPVILTEEEKKEIDDIDAKFAPSYQKPLLYGTDPSQNFYYICPRFWSLKENRSVSEQELQNNNKFRIVNRENEMTIKMDPEYHYVYEFTAHNKGTQRVADLKKIATPSGIPLPCCYTTAAVAKKGNKAVSEYITEKDPPLEPTRLGLLPKGLEMFFNIDRTEFMDAKNKLRQNRPTLLRYGVERTTGPVADQSFLACFADLYGYTQSAGTKIVSVTVDEFIQHCIKSLSIDQFLQLHNGSLATIFKPLTLPPNINTKKYESTAFGQRANKHETLYKDTIAAYENFLNYLKDPSVSKTHEYLWDLMTTPNPNLFKNPLNLIIVELVKTDSTEHIQIICPTNLHSSNQFNEKNDTVILYKKDDIYEPIYIYEESGLKKKYLKMFVTKQMVQKKMYHLIILLKRIQSYMASQCAQTSLTGSLIKSYKSAPSLGELIEILTVADSPYRVHCQVLNFDNKVVGVHLLPVKEGEYNPAFICCRPSALVDGLLATYVDDEHLVQTLESTLESLEQVHAVFPQIPCKPMFMVVETASAAKPKGRSNYVAIEKIIVGILTETNQMIPVHSVRFDPTIHNQLPELEQTSVNTIDKVVTTIDAKEDVERVSQMNRYTLEEQFYSAYRATVRHLIQDFANLSVKRELLSIIEDTTQYMQDKLIKIGEIIMELSANHIVFVDYDPLHLTDIHTCIGYNKNQCVAKEYCKSSGGCALKIPKMNLVHGVANEDLYVSRLADECLRYRRIQHFMFENTVNITNIEYRINSDELIILENLLMGTDKYDSTYFDDLEAFQENSYIHTIPFDLAQPNIPVKQRVIDLTKEPVVKEANIEDTKEANKEANKEEPREEQTMCNVDVGEVIGNIQNSIWRKIFARHDCKEAIFSNENALCTFNVLSKIINQPVNIIKQTLVNQYTGLASMHFSSIIKLWVLDRKLTKPQGKAFKPERINEFIQAATYYLTDIDIWTISSTLKIPIVLFNPSGLKIFHACAEKQKWSWILCSPIVGANRVFFIRSPSEDSLVVNKLPKYHLIMPEIEMPPELDVAKANPIQIEPLDQFFMRL
jgi:hypothetical protein